MKRLLLTATLAAATFTAATFTAMAPAQALNLSNGLFAAALINAEFDRRPRVPGGSGCDTPRDIREHPACTPR